MGKSLSQNQRDCPLLISAGNRVQIGKRVFQYWNSREIEGTVKTMTIKCTPLSELLMIVVVDDGTDPEIKIETGRIAGFDFGLKTFLTCSDVAFIELPRRVQTPALAFVPLPWGK